MKLYDMNADTEYSLPALYREWESLRREDPANYTDSFRYDLFRILMDTINDRNDYEIIGYTGKEISNIIIRLRESLRKQETEA